MQWWTDYLEVESTWLAFNFVIHFFEQLRSTTKHRCGCYWITNIHRNKLDDFTMEFNNFNRSRQHEMVLNGISGDVNNWSTLLLAKTKIIQFLDTVYTKFRGESSYDGNANIFERRGRISNMEFQRLLLPSL